MSICFCSAAVLSISSEKKALKEQSPQMVGFAILTKHIGAFHVFFTVRPHVMFRSFFLGSFSSQERSLCFSGYVPFGFIECPCCFLVATVDGRNPGLSGFFTSQVVEPDFFHQQYYLLNQAGYLEQT